MVLSTRFFHRIRSLSLPCFPLAALWLLSGCRPAVREVREGMAVRTDDGTEVRIEAVGERILRVVATPAGEQFRPRESLDVLPVTERPAFTVRTTDSTARLQTAAVAATVDRHSGRVVFTGPGGDTLLAEHPGGREFRAVEIDGDRGYTVRQQFDSPADEAFYGLGQHQSGEFDYKGRNETLYQYNTKVSVPFVVSSRNYGLLWENYSLTRWGDPRDYAQLDEVFDLGGGLQARYVDRSGGELLRTEPRIDYADLEKVKAFPAEFLPRFNGSSITWEGTIVPKESGIHRFLLYYAGYTKLYIDGREAVPEHWRTAWNPNSVKFEADLEAGRACPLRVEWRPDGGVSYLSLKALSPRPEEEQQRMSWWSELGDGIDYYFVAGANADEVIAGYRTLTGKSPIMPRWALGYWQSRERYKTQDELLEAVAEHRRRHIGLDNIVLDWSYWEEDSWGSHEFEAARFPDPEAMIDSVHRMNGRIMISVWPKFYHTTEHYRELAAIGAIYPRAVQDSIRDWIGRGYIGSFYDAYNPAARRLFWQQMSEHLFSKGIDAWWMDASEPDILSNASLDYRKALQGPTWLGSSTRYLNTYALMNARAIYEGQRGEQPDRRVFLLTRSGYAGQQRYSTATWSGDIGTCWEDMKAQIPAGLNFSLSGLPWWTQDIGGFCVQRKFERAREGSPEREEWRELNARWHQWGIFCPLYRAHGQYPYREPYHIAPDGHPAYRSICASNRLRYRLLPYLYTLAARTWFDDYTIMRALVMDFNGDREAMRCGDQFMCGPALLVCPVCTFGARTRDLYLPEGGWYDFYTGAYCTGGRRLTAEAPYERTPLYVRAGSILPCGPAVEYTGQPTDGALEITVYAGRDASFDLYEDDGTTYGYERGEYARIPLRWEEATATLTLGERTGSFAGMHGRRPVTVRVVTPAGGSTPAREVIYEGKQIQLRIL